MSWIEFLCYNQNKNNSGTEVPTTILTVNKSMNTNTTNRNITTGATDQITALAVAKHSCTSNNNSNSSRDNKNSSLSNKSTKITSLTTATRPAAAVTKAPVTT